MISTESYIESKCQSFKRNGKVTHRNALLQDNDFSIVQQFQAEYRGLVQYYILAQNLSWFSKLYWVMETSLLKTLACKHRSSMKKQKKKYRTTTTSTSGKEVPCLQVVVPRPGKKPLVATWGGISLAHKRKAIIEEKPYKVYTRSCPAFSARRISLPWYARPLGYSVVAILPRRVSSLVMGIQLSRCNLWINSLFPIDNISFRC